MTDLSDTSLAAASPWWRTPAEGRLRIRGGVPLLGRYPISGAKNAVLPLMVSAILTPHPVTLHTVPASLDVAVLANLLQRLGLRVGWSEGVTGLTATLCADQVHPTSVDAGLVSRMRASVLLLGALLGRTGKARLPLPGGDAIGLRGIDFHLTGLRAMGAEISMTGGLIEATAPRGLHGAEILLPQPSVGATENLMLAAVLARGRTIIRNAAQEPEIADIALCLTEMGATVAGAGGAVITIEGGRPLGGAVHYVMPDRIETGTLACAAALTGGELLLAHGRLDLLGAAAPVLEAAGVALTQTAEGLLARRAPGELQGTDFQTMPYPGFATDLQAPVMALFAFATGASTVTETIFEQRFRHVDELRKMGANIQVRGRTALLRGVPRLTGAPVLATDVRAAAALVLAGLGAAGETEIEGLDHLDRGYDGMVRKLADCGADITRLS